MEVTVGNRCPCPQSQPNKEQGQTDDRPAQVCMPAAPIAKAEQELGRTSRQAHRHAVVGKPTLPISAGSTVDWFWRIERIPSRHDVFDLPATFSCHPQMWPQSVTPMLNRNREVASGNATHRGSIGDVTCGTCGWQSSRPVSFRFQHPGRVSTWLEASKHRNGR
jgi:hypothetical protein